PPPSRARRRGSSRTWTCSTRAWRWTSCTRPPPRQVTRRRKRRWHTYRRRPAATCGRSNRHAGRTCPAHRPRSRDLQYSLSDQAVDLPVSPVEPAPAGLADPAHHVPGPRLADPLRELHPPVAVVARGDHPYPKLTLMFEALHDDTVRAVGEHLDRCRRRDGP